jgi:hypothetical protein
MMHSKGEDYFLISHYINAHDSQRLRINMKDGSFAAIVLPDLPLHLRENLMSVLKLGFPDVIKPVESKSQGEKFSYPSLHFSWYNKYCFQVSRFLRRSHSLF